MFDWQAKNEKKREYKGKRWKNKEKEDIITVHGEKYNFGKKVGMKKYNFVEKFITQQLTQQYIFLFRLSKWVRLAELPANESLSQTRAYSRYTGYLLLCAL